MKKLILISLAFALSLIACGRRGGETAQSCAAKNQVWMPPSTCVDPAGVPNTYYTFTVTGDDSGVWPSGAVAKVTVPGQHYYNDGLTQVGDCVGVDAQYFTAGSPVSVEVFFWRVYSL